jgi:3'-phosphoadenosine 5'-phosphosulfate sulfotransferase (PAPS reductase)/FAD synthetase
MTWNGKTTIHDTVPNDRSQSQLIQEAVEVLGEAVEKDDVLFLWTGGKEAQVIADLLLHHVGEAGVSTVTFGTVDTGNHFDEMYDFRDKFVEPHGDKGADTVGPFLGIENWKVERNEELLEHVMENESDPRDYHGFHRGQWMCPACSSKAELDRSNYTLRCENCSHESKLHEIQRQNLEEEEWGVPESCGALKVGGIKNFIDQGYRNMITGVRKDDPLASAGDHEIQHKVERDSPKQHTRYNPLKNWDEENIWAYLKMESVSYPELYDQGYRHTDSECCTENQNAQVSEHGEGGRDARKEAAKQELQDMGYV